MDSVKESGKNRKGFLRDNSKCEFWGTKYGGFYIPKDFGKGIVYSFGIGEDLSFSEEAIRHGNEVYAFDPTPKAIKFVENHILFSNSKFHFFPYGISDCNGKENFYLPIRPDFVSASTIKHKNVDVAYPICVEMKNIRTIMHELKHKQIDILKMDIEGSEFKVVEDMMNPELDPVQIRLCCLETHGRFFENGKDIVDKMYSIMYRNGFNDLYGTDEEPTFVKN